MAFQRKPAMGLLQKLIDFTPEFTVCSLIIRLLHHMIVMRHGDCCMHSLSAIRNRRAGWARSVLLASLLFFFAVEAGYSMQPPPAPLNISQLRQLVSRADLIIVGRVISVRETECVKGGEIRKSVAAALSVEQPLKGDALSDSTIMVEETYPAPDFLKPPPAPVQRDGSGPEKGVVGMRAGPSCYHGRYERGGRVILFLEDIEGTCGYRPLGSGTYDKHLCEFFIGADGIKTVYFRFADDVLPYVTSEDGFIGLIRTLINEDSKKGTK
jgi:hypothetical protein